MPLLLFLFIVWPVTELWLLFKLNGMFGFLPTVLLVFGTGILGAWLAKWQGLQAIIRLQNEIRQGVMPAQAIGDGALILVAGVLLITPGAISDHAHEMPRRLLRRMNITPMPTSSPPLKWMLWSGTRISTTWCPCAASAPRAWSTRAQISLTSLARSSSPMALATRATSTWSSSTGTTG